MGGQLLEVVLEHSSDRWPVRIRRGPDAPLFKPVIEVLELLGIVNYSVNGDTLRANGLTPGDLDELRSYGFGGLIKSSQPVYQQ